MGHLKVSIGYWLVVLQPYMNQIILEMNPDDWDFELLLLLSALTYWDVWTPISRGVEHQYLRSLNAHSVVMNMNIEAIFRWGRWQSKGLLRGLTGWWTISPSSSLKLWLLASCWLLAVNRHNKGKKGHIWWPISGF